MWTLTPSVAWSCFQSKALYPNMFDSRIRKYVVQKVVIRDTTWVRRKYARLGVPQSPPGGTDVPICVLTHPETS